MTARAVAAAALLLAAREAAAVEKLGVMAVGDPPRGPDPDVTELAHQLRAMCRDRVGGVEEVSTMRSRLLGQESGATVSELDRAYAGALAVYQSGEFDSAHRTLKAIVADLEMLPESEEVYEQWVRALLRLAHAALTMGSQRDMDAALLKLARTDLTVQPDPDQYSPSYRRRFEELKGRVRALPKRKLVVTAEGRDGTVFVNGRKMGTTPLTLMLPAGTYRIGGAAGALRVPTFPVDLEGEDRAVVLDFALADALRVNAGPGLALAVGERGYGIIRAGAWLALDRLIVVSRVEEGQAQFLLGSMYDVRRGALLREGSVRMVAGSVPSVNLSALAAFLLTGQGSREVKDRTQDGPREIAPPPSIAAELPPAPAAPPVVVTATPAEVAAPPAALAVRAPPPVPPSAPPAAAPARPVLQPAAADPRPVGPFTPSAGPRSGPESRGAVPLAPATTAAALSAPPLAPTPALASTSVAPSAPPPAAKPAATAVAQPAPVPAATTPPLPTPPPSAPPPAAKPAATGAAPASTAAAQPAPIPAAAAAPPSDPKPAPPPPLAAKPDLRLSPRRPVAGARLSEAQQPRLRHPWMRPVAIGTAVLAVGAAGVAIHQGLGASHAYSSAAALVQPDGNVRWDSVDRYRALRHDGEVARRNMYVSAGAAAVLAGAAGALGWKSFEVDPATGGAVALRF